MIITIPPGFVDTVTAEIEHAVDARRLLAYAAGVPDLSAAVFAPEHPATVVAHPVFHVALEWPLASAGIPGLPMPPELRRLGLHVQHDATHHRPIRPGDVLRTTAAVARAEARSVGVYLETRYETTAAGSGEPVVTNRLGMLYRGVGLEGGTPRTAAEPPATRPPLAAAGSFPVGMADAIVYTECSDIWNPVHTDGEVARAAGLPAPILHGTCCLARAVSILVERFAESDPGRVAHVRSGFGAIVVPDTEVTVFAHRDGGTVLFEARLPDGALALRDGLLRLRTAG